jgi:hypothetical protein
MFDLIEFQTYTKTVKSKNKIVLLFFLSFYCFINVDCQTVDSVRVERIANLVNVKYVLLNSTPDQLFYIKLYCSIDGGLRFEPKSLSGDFGENVPGGRSEYAIIWDVLKDVEELTSVEFFVRADLAGNRSALPINWSKQKAYGFLTAAVGHNNFQGGLRISLLNNWGASWSIMAGQKKYREEHPENTDKYAAFTISIDATKRVIVGSSYRMHLFAGLAILSDENSDGGASIIKCGPEMGVAFEMRRVAFFTNISFVKFPLNGGEPLGESFLSLGIGLRPRKN